MLKTHMAACLVASALTVVPALAQTSPTAPATNVAPVTTPAGPAGTTMGANPNATTGANTTAGSTTAAGGGFVTQREPGMYRASELIGKDVRGGNNEDIGEVGDILIDRNGQVRAVVLDIGGFLGIGETHVAIPMQQVQLRPNQQNAATTGTVGNTTVTTGSTATTAGQSTTARTGTDQNPSNTAAGPGTTGADVIVVLMMTKDQLQNAPKFEDNARGSNAGANTGNRSGTTTGTEAATGTGTTAPRP